jgi:hypothetical protein
MSRKNSEDIFKRGWVMDRAWMRDSNGIIHEGEALLLAMLLKVKKGKHRTAEQEAELQKIIEKPERKKK